MIQYAREDNLGIEEFKTILINSTWEKRPIHDADRLQKMLYHANLIITARENGKIIGVARSISDFVFVRTYPILRSMKIIKDKVLVKN